MFFLFLMIVHNEPVRHVPDARSPTDGRGLNPLLQNPYMVIHPPSLYIGFVGMTHPVRVRHGGAHHGPARRLVAARRAPLDDGARGSSSSFGLTLGMIWAYEELGWGGYWGWDPVENAGLLPWFTATAFLHSVMVQERRGMLQVWNVTLVIVDVLADDLRHVHDPLGRRAVGARVRRGSRSSR